MAGNPASMFDLNSLLTSTLGMQTEGSDVVNSIRKNAADLAAASAKQVEDSNAAAAAAADLDRIKQEDKLRQENQYLAIANRLGTNPDLTGGAVNKLTEVANQALNQQLELRKVITEKTSINFLENPIGYLAARLTVNSDIERHNLAVDTRETAQQQIDWLEKTTKEQFYTANAMTQTVNDQTIRAGQIIAGAAYKAQANQAAQQAARDGISNLLAVRSVDKDSLMLAYQGNAAIQQQKAYSLQLQHLNLSREQFNLAKQAHTEKLNEDSLTLRYIQKGFFNLTGNQMPEQTAKDALVAFKMKNPQYVDFFNSGMSSFMADPKGVQTIYSFSPSDSLDMYASGRLTNISAAQKDVFNKLAEWRREFTSPAVQNELKIDPKDKKGFEGAFNQFIQRKVNESANTPGSTFSPAPIVDTVKFDPKLAQTPLWVKVLEPAQRVGADLSDPNIMSNLIQSAMVEGKLSYADALDAPAFWIKGLELKAKSQNLTAMGIAQPAQYKVGLDMPLSIGKTPVNVLDRLEWARFINQSASRKAIKMVQEQTNLDVGLRVLGPVKGALPRELATLNSDGNGRILDNTTPRQSPYLGNQYTSGERIE